jgi:hypothetical protein
MVVMLFQVVVTLEHTRVVNVHSGDVWNVCIHIHVLIYLSFLQQMKWPLGNIPKKYYIF